MSTLPPESEPSTAPPAVIPPVLPDSSEAIPAIDPDQASAFLLALGGGDSTTTFSFQSYPERPDSKERAGLTKVFHGTAEQCLPDLVRLNEQGAAVYVTVNATDGRGRKTENIASCRAAFVDHDAEKDGPLATPIRAEATIRIFTGHGEHYYWLHPTPEPVTGFTACQKILAGIYNTDPAVSDLPRVMRIPGFINWKRVPVLAHIIAIKAELTYTRQDILALHSATNLPTQDELPMSPAKSKDFAPANHQKILDGCSWYRTCQEQAGTLSEPNWFAQMQVTVRCENGRTTGHSLSEPHAQYSETETDKKLDHAAKFGPPTCTFVEGTLKHPGCQTCPHRGTIKSPIVLGSSQAVPAMSLADARVAAIAAVAALTNGKAEEFMAASTFEALATLPEEERDQHVTRIRSLLADNKKLAKAVPLSTFNKRMSKATARLQREATASARAAGLLPRISVDGRAFRELCDAALAALVGANQPKPVVFVQVCSLVRVLTDAQGLPYIVTYTRPTLRGRLARVADFVSGPQDNPVIPQDEVIDDILTHGEWRDLPPLHGISPIPIARSDGTFRMDPGYDAVTGLIYLPGKASSIPVIPDVPTTTDVTNAVIVLWEPFKEFPWLDGSAKAHVFALILTLILRPAIDGNVPLFVLLANLPGSGKTLLLELIVTLVYGQNDWTTFPYQTNEDETRKRITSTLLEGRPIVVVDNAEGTVNSAALASVVTSRQWSDRLLGGNRNARVRNGAVFVLNGNNLFLGDDLNRRAVLAEMRSQEESPYLRASFSIANVRTWVRERREQLLSAALILVRNWHLRGCPPPASPAVLGNFETWCQTIGGVLSAAGVDGFLSNTTRVRELNDGLSTQWGGFLHALFLRFLDQPFTIRSICEELPDPRDKLAGPGFRLFDETLPNELASRRDKGAGALQHGFGQAFKKIINTPYRDFTLHGAGTDLTSHVKMYTVACRDLNRLPEPYRSAMWLVTWLRTSSWWSLTENRSRSEVSDLALFAGSLALPGGLSASLPVLTSPPTSTEAGVADLVQWLRFFWSTVTDNVRPMTDVLISTTCERIFGEKATS